MRLWLFPDLVTAPCPHYLQFWGFLLKQLHFSCATFKNSQKTTDFLSCPPSGGLARRIKLGGGRTEIHKVDGHMEALSIRSLISATSWHCLVPCENFLWSGRETCIVSEHFLEPSPYLPFKKLKSPSSHDFTNREIILHISAHLKTQLFLKVHTLGKLCKNWKMTNQRMCACPSSQHHSESLFHPQRTCPEQSSPFCLMILQKNWHG